MRKLRLNHTSSRLPNITSVLPPPMSNMPPYPSTLPANPSEASRFSGYHVDIHAAFAADETEKFVPVGRPRAQRLSETEEMISGVVLLCDINKFVDRLRGARHRRRHDASFFHHALADAHHAQRFKVRADPAALHVRDHQPRRVSAKVYHCVKRHVAPPLLHMLHHIPAGCKWQ